MLQTCFLPLLSVDHAPSRELISILQDFLRSYPSVQIVFCLFITQSTIQFVLLPLVEEQNISKWSADVVLRCFDASLSLSIREMVAKELLKENGMVASEFSVPIANGIIAIDEKKSFSEGLFRFLSNCVGNKAISAVPLLNLFRKYLKTYEEHLHPKKDALLLLLQQLDTNHPLKKVVNSMVCKL